MQITVTQDHPGEILERDPEELAKAVTGEIKRIGAIRDDDHPLSPFPVLRGDLEGAEGVVKEMLGRAIEAVSKLEE